MICDLGNSDIRAAIKESKERFNYDKFAGAYFIGDMPRNYDATGKWVRLKFTCNGKAYNDIDIRELSEGDRKQMAILTTVPEDDSNIARIISRSIMNDYDYAKDSDVQLLGIFDGATLAGAISIADRWGKLMHIRNIFIARNYRGRKLDYI